MEVSFRPDVTQGCHKEGSSREIVVLKILREREKSTGVCQWHSSLEGIECVFSDLISRKRRRKGGSKRERERAIWSHLQGLVTMATNKEYMSSLHH